MAKDVQSIPQLWDSFQKLIDIALRESEKDEYKTINPEFIVAIEESFKDIFDIASNLLMILRFGISFVMLELDRDINFTQRGAIDLDVKTEPFTLKFNPLFLNGSTFNEFLGLLEVEMYRLFWNHPAVFSKVNLLKEDGIHSKLEKPSDAAMVEVLLETFNRASNESKRKDIIKVPSKLTKRVNIEKECNSKSAMRDQDIEYYYAFLNKHSKNCLKCDHPMDDHFTEIPMDLESDLNEPEPEIDDTQESKEEKNKQERDTKNENISDLERALQEYMRSSSSIPNNESGEDKETESGESKKPNSGKQKSTRVFTGCPVKNGQSISVQSKGISDSQNGQDKGDMTPGEGQFNPSEEKFNSTKNSQYLKNYQDRIASPLNQNGKRTRQWEDLESEDIENRTKNLVLAALNKMDDKSRGLMPNNVMSQIEAFLRPPEVDWQQVLRGMMGSVPVPYRRTKTRLDRRQPYRADIAGRMPKKIVKVVLAIDTSGSMSDDDIKYVVEEIINLVKVYKFEITVIECDSEINRIYKIKEVKDIDYKVHGRGGTYFTPVIDYLNGDVSKEMKKKYPEAGNYKDALFIFFTDGGGESSIPQPKVRRTLWLVLHDERYLSVEKHYGVVKALSKDKKYKTKGIRI